MQQEIAYKIAEAAVRAMESGLASFLADPRIRRICHTGTETG